MATAAVKAHAAAGVSPIATLVCGINVEQSPSGKPNAKAKGKGLGVSAQFIGDDGGKGGEGGEGGEGGGEGGCGASGGASWWMVTSVSVHAELQYVCHVARPGGEDESVELMYAQTKQSPSPSRSLAAVVLGALSSNRQAGIPALPSSPSQSGSQ